MSKEFKENECKCEGCQNMCMTSPCFPTPQEVEVLIEEGFGDQLAPTMFINIHDGKKYSLIAPIGIETVHDIDGIKVKLPTCTFFNDKKCQLHNLCLKPLEGRLANHNNTEEDSLNLRLHVLESWGTLLDSVIKDR
jgi:hypothetical protein